MSSDNSGKGKPETKQHHKGIIIYRHFQLGYTPHSAFEPCVMRELFHTLGNTLGAVFTSTEDSETNSLALGTCSVLAPQSSGPSSVFTVHQGSIWEALGRAVTFPSALPTCRAGSLTLGPGGLGQP